MGNHPSHPSIPLDGYLAVRASIEARFPPSQELRQVKPTAATACWGAPGGELHATLSGGRPQENPVAGEPSRSNVPLLLNRVAAGPLVPPTLSVAETTDTNSDWAPDEFEAAASSEILGGPSQSFTREKAPRVRAQSPQPFPSMSHCSPTFSRKAETHKHQLPEREISGSNSRSSRSNSSGSSDGGSACSTRKVYAVSAFPGPSSRPKHLDATLVASSGGAQRPRQDRSQQKNSSRSPPGACIADQHKAGLPVGTRQTRVARGAPEGRAVGVPSAGAEEHEMFCPLSPNSALASCTPSKASSKSAPKTMGQTAVLVGTTSSSQGMPIERNISYGPTCNHLPFLEGRALQALLPFLFGRTLGVCMSVCVHWFMRISNGLADMCSPIVRGFEASYGKYLHPVNATVKLQALHTTEGNGVRLDWVITAKVLPPSANHVLSLGYCFKYRPPSSLNGWHVPSRCTFTGRDFSGRADGISLMSSRSYLRRLQGGCQSPGAIIRPPSCALGEATELRREAPMFSVAVAPAASKRRLWLHRDMCRFHGDETGQAASSHLGPVCVGDFVEVPVVLSNGIGASDVSSIQWFPISIARRVPRVLSGPRAVDAASKGLYEGCSLELQYTEWFDSDQYRHMTTERLQRAECLEPELHHESTEYSGIDLLVRRSLYRAMQEGTAGAAAQRAWGLQCKVVPQEAPIVFPLTRKGLLHDRSTCLQLRVGDTLESYLTIGGANV